MNIPYLFFTAKLDNPKLLNIKRGEKWEITSGKEFLNTIKQSSVGIRRLNAQRKISFKKQELVGLISPSTPTWLVYSQTLMASNAVPVPIFVNVSKANLAYQIKETGMRYVFVSGEDALEAIKPFLNKLKKVIYSDISSAKIPNKQKKLFLPFSEITELGRKLLKTQKKDTFLDDIKKIKPDQLAVIIYTSGSTGEPKGVMLTHTNLLHQLQGLAKIYPLVSNRDYAVSCLPLAHIFEHTIISHFMALNLSIYFSPNLNQLGDIIREIRPTVMTAVPRILSKVYEKMSSSPQQQKGLKKILVAKAVDYAINHPLTKSSNEKDQHSWYYPIFEKLVYKKFRQALGDNFRVLVNGGAALPHPVLRFFRNIGINVVEGYGLTETSPVVAANHLTYNKPYSVGPPLPGVLVKIGNGEILTKSPSVMKGYFKKPKMTQSVMSKGWFKTGDLGEIDDESNVIITGRKKDLCKLSNGKYIAPLYLEQKLELSPVVDTALVVADDKKYVSALLFMNTDLEKIEKAERELREHIKNINKELNPWEKIIRFKAIWKKLSIDEGDITPKMNIRRAHLLNKYAAEIKELY